MVKYEMLRRKPTPKYKVTAADGRVGVVTKMDNAPRCERWHLYFATEEGEPMPIEKWPEAEEVQVAHFKSRRAAFHFFETGEKFKTRPVYAGLRGGGSKRIR